MNEFEAFSYDSEEYELFFKLLSWRRKSFILKTKNIFFMYVSPYTRFLANTYSYSSKWRLFTNISNPNYFGNSVALTMKFLF